MKTVADEAQVERSELSLWMAILMLGVGSFIFINTEFLPVGLLSDIATFYSVTIGQAGLMVTVPGVAAALAAPALTRYLGKVDRRKILLSMSVLLLVSNLLMAFSNSFVLSLFGRLLLGIGVGGFWSFAVPYGVNIVKEYQKGRATTIITAGVAAGTVAGVPLGTFLGQNFGWQNAFLLNAALTGIVLLLQLKVLPAQEGDTSLNFRQMVGVILEGSVAKRLLSTMFFAGAHFCSFTYFEMILTKEAGVDPSSLPKMFLLYGLMGFAATFIAEFLVKKIGAKSTFRLATILLVVAVVAMLSASLNSTLAIAITMLWGLAYGLMPVSINIWLYEANEKDYVISTASNVSLYQVAVAAGSFFGGVAYSTAGVEAMIFVSAAVGLICLFVGFVKTAR